MNSMARNTINNDTFSVYDDRVMTDLLNFEVLHSLVLLIPSDCYVSGGKFYGGFFKRSL